MGQREKLIELLDGLSVDTHDDVISVVDWLIANGVVVLECRCEECYYRDRECECWCNFHDTKITRDGFCNYALREGGDE